MSNNTADVLAYMPMWPMLETLHCRPCPFHGYFFYIPQSFLTVPPYQTTGQLWLGKQWTHVHLFPKSCFLAFCLSLPLFLHCWRMTYCSCHQGSVGVWLIECACVCVCVSLDGHLGSWPSSWIQSLLLNSDSLPLSLSPLLALPA